MITDGRLDKSHSEQRLFQETICLIPLYEIADGAYNVLTYNVKIVLDEVPFNKEQ